MRPAHRFRLLSPELLESRRLLAADPQPLVEIGDHALSLLPNLVQLGSVTLMAGELDERGTELLAMDAGATTPRLVKDLRPGPFGSVPEQIVVFGSFAYFVADDGAHGRELWRTDGTEAGTTLFKDISPGAASSEIYALTTTPDRLLFQANDAEHGGELWTSDGTVAGTTMLKDIRPGPDSSSPFEFATYNGRVYFSANDGVHGQELWSTDGTSQGTAMLFDVRPGEEGSYPARFTAATGGDLFFTAYSSGLWHTDGTAEGTAYVDFTPSYPPDNTFPPFIGDFVDVNGTIFFAGVGRMWSVSGDGAETETWYNTTWFAGPSPSVAVGKYVICGGQRGGVFAFDSSSGGTVFLHAKPLSWQLHGSVLYFLGESDQGTIELWRFDGTAAGPQRIQQAPGKGATLLGAVDDTLFFVLDDGPGFALWKCGTAVGSTFERIADTIPSRDSIGNVEPAVYLDGRAYFATTSAGGGELWSSDGTKAGTYRVLGNAPGVASYLSSVRSTHLGLLMSYDDGVHGMELWISDGTPNGSRMVKDIVPGVGGSSANDFYDVGDYVLFAAYDEVHGYELWRTDGTKEGTVLVKDIYPGPNHSYINYGQVLNGVLYFSADDGVHGRELWRSDGTADGTYLVRDIYVGGSADLWLSYVLNGQIIFIAADESGRHLWKSDGTEAGTVKVGGPDMGLIDIFRIADHKIYFATRPINQNRQLWVTDGTEAGTILLDPDIGYDASVNLQAVTLGDKLIFTVLDDSGWRICQSDGTVAGTGILADNWPNDYRTLPSFMQRIGDHVIFSADDGVHGYEPWITDGTPEGTELWLDIDPGPGTVWPSAIGVVNGYLLFAAYSESQGSELWSVQLPAPPEPSFDSYAVSVGHLLRGASVLMNDRDANGDALQAILVDQPLHGLLQFARDGSFTYRPNPGFYGRDTFRYREVDAYFESEPAEVTLEVALIPGDANLDGRVDLTDFGRLKDHFGGLGTREQGDFNGDGKIDLADFGILKNAFGTTEPEDDD